MALPFTFKKYLKAKEELWKLKIFHHCKNYIKSSKKLLIKETKILQNII